MKIYYVTGNELKIKLAKSIFEKNGVEVIQEDIETPEIQSLDCKEIADYSSKYAANLLNKPVLKNDSGFFIEALDGFPGALAKYAEDKIKADGFIKLLEGKDNRKAYWVEILSYCEPGGNPVSFASYSYGKIANEVHEGIGYDYDKIFIPEDDTRTFSEMSEEEHIAFFNQDAYLGLLDYLRRKDEK